MSNWKLINKKPLPAEPNKKILVAYIFNGVISWMHLIEYNHYHGFYFYVHDCEVKGDAYLDCSVNLSDNNYTHWAEVPEFDGEPFNYA